jgi:fructoselysine-6-P-deglycase FrlB-like protein
MHIPNDNGHSSHNGNGHNPHFYWIDHEIIPEFMLATGQVTGMNYEYDFKLAEAAGKHAEAMMNAGYVYHTPKEMMFGEAENVGMIEVIASDFKRALRRLAEGFKDDHDHGHNLIAFRRIGVGAAVRLARPVPLLYVVQRFAKRAA